MMSGRLTPKIEVWDNACELPSRQPTLAHHMRHLGYHTVLSGKMHFIGPDQLHGFDERTVTDVYPSEYDWVAEAYLAIDQGPQIIMIENYRTGLLWDLFMGNEDIQAGLTKLGF